MREETAAVQITSIVSRMMVVICRYLDYTSNDRRDLISLNERARATTTVCHYCLFIQFYTHHSPQRMRQKERHVDQVL
jgi:hypothetical protein